MVTMNLWAVIAIAALSMIACGFIGLLAGIRIGYYHGIAAAMNTDFFYGIAAAPKLAGEGHD